MDAPDTTPQVMLAEQFSRALIEKLGPRAIQVARQQAASANGVAKASWDMIVRTLERE